MGGRTVTLKLRYADFRTVTRSRTVAVPVATADMIAPMIAELLETLIPLPMGVRLLGATLSGLDNGALSDEIITRQGILL